MLYYRINLGGAERPPELFGYTSTGADADLHECIVHGYRTFGITPPMRFDPPEQGWVDLCGGWQIVSVGDFSPNAHARINGPWSNLIAVVSVGGADWCIPHILGLDGTRAFKVVYGGPDYAPRLTSEQASALALATEIRACLSNGTLPDMSVRARWVARILPLTYHLSEGSIALLGLPEDLIDQTLRVVAGYYELGR